MTLTWTMTPAQLCARYYIDHVTLNNVDDDLDNPNVPDWPPLLNRRHAAQFLDIGTKWLSDLSGNGPRGGKLHNCRVRGKVYWKLTDLQAYQESTTR